MKTSIIIPILNESGKIENIVSLVDSIKGDKEIIFVDGGSTDGTVELIPSRFRIISSEKGRANQMNTGAAHAKGDILFFLHCDSVIDTDALLDIESAFDKGFLAGCFTMKFDDESLMLRLIAYLSNLRAALLKIMFGDQGIFIKKELFHKLGGFPPIPIMEDLEFSIKLKKSTDIIQLKHNIITSARRFKTKGILKTIMFMHVLKIMYFAGVSPDKLNMMYRNVR